MDQTKTEPDYFTVKEAAEHLRIHPQTVYTLLRSGEMEGLKIGEQWRIPADQFYDAGERTLATA